MRRARRPRSTWRWRATPRSAASSRSGGAPIGYAHAVEIGLWGAQRARGSAAGHLGHRPLHRLGRAPRRGLGRSARSTLLAEEVFATTLGRGLLRRRVDQERGRRAGLRAGGLPLAADLAATRCSGPCWLMLKDRPTRRQLAELAGRDQQAARPCSVLSPAISSSVLLTRPSRVALPRRARPRPRLRRRRMRLAREGCLRRRQLAERPAPTARRS